MKKFIYTLVLLVLSNFVLATDFYISNSGNDANNGTSAATAWKTITKLNSSWGSISSGDRILFERGGTFFGSINVTKSGITLGAYGTGEKPIITGFHTVTSWTSIGSNKWTSTIPTSLNYIRLLTINGQLARNGRYPNFSDGFSDWIRYTNKLDAVTPITVNSAAAVPTQYADGELVLFKNNWNLDVMPINSISGNSIVCTNPAGQWGLAQNAYQANWGFFVQNSLAALDQQNEWHFSNSTKVLTIFSTTDPSARVTKIPILQNLITLGNTSNITIDGLDVQGATEKGISCSGGSNITIKNCVVRYVQGWGMDLRTSNLNITDNIIRDIGSNGVWLGGNATFARNTIKACASIEGLSGLMSGGSGALGNGDSQHSGVDINSGNTTCSQNIIDSIGYVGIRFAGNNLLIEKNVIQNTTITKSDGGAIYSWDFNGSSIYSNRIVKNNIMLSIGKFLYGTGTPTGNTQGYGLYLDGGTNNVICDSNVIGPNIYNQNSIGTWNGGITNTFDDAAIMLNFPINITLRNNVVFGWPDAMEIWRWPGYPAATGNRIVSNALYVNGGGAGLGNWNQSFQYQDIAPATGAQVQTQVRAMGYMDSNYVSDFAPSPFQYGSNTTNNVNDGLGGLKLSNWRTWSLKDANSQSFPSTTPDFQYNATATSRVYSFPGLSKKDYKGVVYNNSAVIPPFYGNIFFPNGTATGAITVTATATPIRCNGGNTTITVAASGGTAPYTGTGTFTRTAGTYTFNVTDAVGGAGSATITVTQPAALTAGNPTAPVITTVGGTTTITQPTPTGGTAPFQYQLGTGAFQGTNTWSGVAAGTYTITIRDACSTTITKNITIAPFVVTNIVVTTIATPINCNGGNSTVTVSASGGTTPYTGIGTFTRTAGTYTFTVTDAAGVSGSSTITITQPTSLTAGNPTAPAITTAGGTTTITQPVATGGTSPYQYQLGTGTFQGTNTFSGVVAGTYTITIRDANQCTITKTITIAPFTAPAYQAKILSVNYGASTWAQNETRNVQVTIQNTGSATWTDGTGGTKDINVGIKWNGWSDYHSRTDAHPCAPGETRTYTLTVRAANATFTSQSTPTAPPTYSTPLALGNNNLTVDLVNELTCWFGNNSGGCGPGNTRFVTPVITIVTPTVPLASTAIAPAILCGGGTTTIVVTATGGTPPYTGTGTFVKPAGTHTFTVTDAAGVTTTSVVTLVDPPALVVTASATPIACVGGNSTITIGATGGTPPYTGVGTFVRPAGTYSFIVTDSNGCNVTIGAGLQDPQFVTPIINVGSVVSPGSVVRLNQPLDTVLAGRPSGGISAVAYPNPSSDGFQLKIQTETNENVTISVYDINGKLKVQTKGAPTRIYSFGSNFIAGTYFVKVIQSTKSTQLKVVKN